MSRFVVVLPLHPLAAGDGFAVSAWPLHITVVLPFSTTLEVPALTAALAAASAVSAPLTVAVGADAMFGPRGDQPVSLVHPSPQLIALHTRMSEAVERAGVHLRNTRFSGAGYRPHVTMKGPARVHEGDRLTLRQLALVDMTKHPETAERVVSAVIDLGRPPVH